MQFFHFKAVFIKGKLIADRLKQIFSSNMMRGKDILEILVKAVVNHD